jgi:quercetin dioxygenase-like cupin family protein
MLERLRRPEEIAQARDTNARRHPLLRLVGRDEVEAESPVWHEAFPGIEFRTLASGPEMMLTLLRLERGAAVPVHSHRAAQAGYVLEGCLRLTTSEDQRTVSAGECYVVPPGLSHQVRAIEPTTVLDAFAPGFGSVPEAGLLEEEVVEPQAPSGSVRRLRRRARRTGAASLERRAVEES